MYGSLLSKHNEIASYNLVYVLGGIQQIFFKL